ncbi:MAG: ABC transporter ATP-binding protein [bacterium]
MGDNPVLEAEGLFKSFAGTKGTIEVLKGLDLSVARGEVLSIIGASGVGKSTLLQILGSLDRPDAGRVEINGRPVDSLSGRELNELRNKFIGFVFQFHFLLPEFTALENVMMPGLIGGGSWGDSHDRASSLLRRVGLEERFYHKPSELSGGEQQRVAVARALTNAPEVILADEPTGNLDDVSSEGLHTLIRELSRQESKTFVVVTHKSDFARFADRTLILENGTLHASAG